MKKINGLILGLLVGTVACFGATKFDAVTDGSDVELVFGAGGHSVTAIAALSDAAGNTLKVYVRNNKGFYNPNAAVTSGAQVITLNNGSHEISTNDLVVVEYPDKSVGKFTVSASQTNSVTLSSGVAAALTTDSRIWELTQVYQLDVGTTLVTPEGNPIVDVPSESPVFINLTGETNANASATVK